MSREFTEERFLKDVETHAIEIIRDDAEYRHIRFKRPGTTCYYFDLITWPGYLCYTGDMGTYVFTRLRDMFEFFRKNPTNLFSIDFRYWAEKVQAGDKSSQGDGIKEFSVERFQANVRRWVEEDAEANFPDLEDAEAVRLHNAAYAELRAAVEDEVCGCDDNGVRAFDAANEFEHTGEAWRAFHGERAKFEFTDFWETDNDEYTFRFLWCCHALAWGIHQYDLTKETAKPAEVQAG